MAAIGDQLTTPEAGWKRYEATTSLVKGKGDLIINSNVGYSNGNALYLIQQGESFLFDFIGDKVRIIDVLAQTRTDKIVVKIDGVVVGEFSEYTTDANQFKTLVFEKKGLSYSRHTVELISDKQYSSNYNMSLDLIDIDSNGRVLHPDEVTDPKELEVGKRIRCHYQASSGQVGAFSGLGEETSDFIPIASTATPNGDFYFIMVEDRNGRKMLVADRNIQHSISWDTLNTAGIASGSGFESSNVPDNLTIGNPYTISRYGNTSLAKSQLGKSKGKWYWEVVINGFTGGHGYIGIGDSNTRCDGTFGYDSNAWGYRPSGRLKESSSPNIPAPTSAVGDIIGIALDLDNGTIKYFKNGSEIASSNGIILNKTYYAMAGYIDTTGDITISYNLGLKDFKFDMPDGYSPYNNKIDNVFSLTTRLMTGGTSSTDKDNEWDKYIVNSSLNEAITAGDNNVWNWNKVWSVTYTTFSGSSANRVSRGGSSVTGHGNNITSWNRTDNGFRPVLEIEDLTQYRSFVKIDGEYKKLDSTWQTISTTLPSVDTFMNEGMKNLSVVDRKLTTFTIPMDDNTPQGQPLGNGKVFKEKINLKKFIEINSINVK